MKMNFKFFIFVFAIAFLSVYAVIEVADASNFSQQITLWQGWNIVSTPRVLESHLFSAEENSANFDIFVLDASSVSGWSTMADLGQSEFTPLYGYFINNKTGVNQTLTFNYADNTTPNKRLFERTFSKTGWYSIGVANPTYMKTQCADTSDTNNVANILDSLSGNHSTVVDFTNSNSSDVAIATKWNAVVPSDLNSLNDFRETKGYAIFITKENALYGGFQNTDEPDLCFPPSPPPPPPPPTLDIQLASTPTSQTHVRGVRGIPLVGLSFRASNADIKLSSVRVTASSSTGTLTSGELQSLALYDGATRVSDIKSLDSTNLNATFSGLNLVIPAGQTKILTVKGDLDANATDNDVYYVYLASTGTDDVTAFDMDGNAATIASTAVAANKGGTVKVTVTKSGDVSVVKAPDDAESEAGIVIAGKEEVLAKFRFTATNEEMTINKMQLLVVPTNSATATSADAADEVPIVKLYDGATQIGNAAGYTVQASGANSGIVVIENLGWKIPKDGSKTLTVKGVLNTITGGADSGASIYVSVHASNFEAQGATAKDTTITAATGNEKVLYKTKPTISLPSFSAGKLSAGAMKVLRFRIAADANEQVSWKKIQIYAQMTGATLTAVDASPGTTGNVKITDVSLGSDLKIGTAYSGTGTASTTQAAIPGGQSGYVTLILDSEQTISAGQSKDYDLTLSFRDISSTAGSAFANLRLNRQETTKVAGTTYNNVETSTEDGKPSFIWSDNSVTNHSESSADWANGVYVKVLPSDPVTISN